MRPSRLAGMSGIGVDRMGDRADAMKGRDFLRLENLDTDIAPHERAIAASRAAVAEDKNNVVETPTQKVTFEADPLAVLSASVRYYKAEK